MYNPVKITPAVIEFVDIAGLVKGASKGEGLGNKFLSHIRETDAIIHVVRCFENDDIIHVEGSVDPARDIETINFELIFSDIEMVDRRLDRTMKAMKGDKSLAKEVEFLKNLKAHLESGKCARSYDCDDDEKAVLNDMALLTSKPVIYACNMSEDDFANNIEENERYRAVCKIAEDEVRRLSRFAPKWKPKLQASARKKRKCSLPTSALNREVLISSFSAAMICSDSSRI